MHLPPGSPPIPTLPFSFPQTEPLPQPPTNLLRHLPLPAPLSAIYTPIINLLSPILAKCPNNLFNLIYISFIPHFHVAYPVYEPQTTQAS